MIEPGEKAPDFTLLNQERKEVKLSDFGGSKVVIYFYPKASTPGCTIQACGIRDVHDELEELDAVVLGVSPDSVDVVKKFHDKQGLTFDLLADSDREVCELYGVWVEKINFGKKRFGVQRSTFVIDPEGVVSDTIKKANPATHANRIQKMLAKIDES